MSNKIQLRETESGPKWKQELVKEHKFDFIDLRPFRNTSCLTMLRYLFLLCSIVVSFLAYIADLWTAVILLVYDKWSLSVQPKIPFYISKWIYVGCIALSFLILAWEIRNTRNVMATRDVSLAVTNPLAYRTYSVKSYSHFCLLRRIKSSTKWSDVIIFYVFYTLKGWKKVIVAQAPRQIIAGITVYALLRSAWSDNNGQFHFATDWDVYGTDWQQRVALISMSFTCVLWVLSALSILIAVFLYFFVLCQIQGNLKEYCCHKIDKRINELLEKQNMKNRKKLERNRTYVQNTTPKEQDQGIHLATVEKSTTPIIQNADAHNLHAEEDSIWRYYDYQTTPTAHPQSNDMDHNQAYYNYQPTNAYTEQREMYYDWQAQSNYTNSREPDEYAYHYSNYNNQPSYNAQPHYEPVVPSATAAYDYNNTKSNVLNQNTANYMDYQHYHATSNHHQYQYYKN